MKKFFDKKMMDWKFRKAGDGHTLTEEKPPPKQSQVTKQPAPHRPPTDSSQAAGSAALARLEAQERGKHGPSSSSAIKRQLSANSGLQQTGAQAHPSRKECAQPSAKPVAAPTQASSSPKVFDLASKSVVVHVVCPICKRSVPHSTVQQHFTSCLQEEYLKEPLSSSVQMMYTLCKDQDKRKLCIDTLCKYLDNIIQHAGEEKYCKIRMNNKAFVERVTIVEGAMLFLEAVGFHQQLLPHQDGEEQFLVLSEDRAKDVETLQVQKEMLISVQPLKWTLDRNLQVFRPSPRATHFDLPGEFYNLTLEEIKREQKQRTDTVEQQQVLRTRAMREKDETKMALRYYRFVLLRIRLPDGLLLQGVFRPLDKFADVRIFISEALSNPASLFSLSAFGKQILDEQATLIKQGLVPSAVLNLSWDVSSPSPESPFLKPELLARVQDL